MIMHRQVVVSAMFMMMVVNNEPVFIEMNLTAESGFAQMNGGPLFGKYLDEVMERVSKVHKDYRNSVEMKFENGSRLMMKV